MTGQIVVAADSATLLDIERILGSGTWTFLRSDRWVANYQVESEEAARRLVAELRDNQHSAVAGPPDSGRAVAWNNWNRPTPVGRNAEVCFPWVPSNAEIVIEIDPGVGFGVGDHPSTRLLLEELALRVKGGESVLDVGCGSGVLAVGFQTAWFVGAGMMVAGGGGWGCGWWLMRRSLLRRVTMVWMKR